MHKYGGAYTSWYHMISRCTNPNDPDYPDYGGRTPPITVCKEWLTDKAPSRRYGFKVFLREMGPRPEGTMLDRKDGFKGYYKDNCQWTTTTASARNRRGILLNYNHVLVIKGLLRSVKADCSRNYAHKVISEVIGVSLYTIQDIDRGKSWREVP
jgi:hypothetical protein